MTIQSDNTKGRSLADNFWAELGLLTAVLVTTGEKSKKKPPCSSDLRPLISAQVGFVHVVSLTVPFRLIGQPEPDCRHVE